MNEVVHIEHRGGFAFLVRFDDGLEAVFDLAPLLDDGPVFAPVRDPDFFRRATIEGGTIAWPNGADIAPETLYEMCAKENAERRCRA